MVGLGIAELVLLAMLAGGGLVTAVIVFFAVIRLANVLEEKGESGAALSLVEDSTQLKSEDVRGDLMKLKLSLTTSTPVELSHQVDMMLEKLSSAKNG